MSVPNSMCTSLTRFIFSEETGHWYATGELTEILNSFQIIAKIVSAMVRRAGLNHFFGISDKSKESKKLVTLANDVFSSILVPSGMVGLMISKSSKNPIDIPKEKKGKFIICYDPLDGLRNMECALSVGSIFCVMVKETEGLPTLEDAFNIQTKIVAAGYMLYGSCTNFVFSTRGGVNGFVLDPQVGEFFSTDKAIKIPKKGNIYSINEGYTSFWDEGTKAYVFEKKFPRQGKPYISRYVGSMVADIHRTIKLGGIFLFPATIESAEGTLELLCECRPMAFIVLQAGGAATNGTMPLMDVRITEIHQKSPIFIGSKDDVDDLMRVFANFRLKKKS